MHQDHATMQLPLSVRDGKQTAIVDASGRKLLTIAGSPSQATVLLAMDICKYCNRPGAVRRMKGCIQGPIAKPAIEPCQAK
jgi:hypothetical protein